VFYPHDLPRSRELAYASRRLTPLRSRARQVFAAGVQRRQKASSSRSKRELRCRRSRRSRGHRHGDYRTFVQRSDRRADHEAQARQTANVRARQPRSVSSSIARPRMSLIIRAAPKVSQSDAPPNLLRITYSIPLEEPVSHTSETVRFRVQRCTRTGMVQRVRTLAVSLATSSADVRRPREAITIKSQPLFFAVSTIP